MRLSLFPAIDECAGDNPYDHICTDTCESYSCACISGYMLQEGGRSCQGLSCCLKVKSCNVVYMCVTRLDIDECNILGLSVCEETCVNTNGSFHCECRRSGYVLGDDGVSCCRVLVDFDSSDETTLNPQEVLLASGRSKHFLAENPVLLDAQKFGNEVCLSWKWPIVMFVRHTVCPCCGLGMV